MAENSPSAAPFPAPSMRIDAASPDPVSGIGALVSGPAGASPMTGNGLAAASRPTCPGRVTWMTAPEREVSECVLPRGHRGDHRDGIGYPWNEGRWLD